MVWVVFLVEPWDVFGWEIELIAMSVANQWEFSLMDELPLSTCRRRHVNERDKTVFGVFGAHLRFGSFTLIVLMEAKHYLCRY